MIDETSERSCIKESHPRAGNVPMSLKTRNLHPLVKSMVEFYGVSSLQNNRKKQPNDSGDMMIVSRFFLNWPIHCVAFFPRISDCYKMKKQLLAHERPTEATTAK